MKINIKNLTLTVSLIINFAVFFLIGLSSSSKNYRISCFPTDAESVIAACVVSFPKDGTAAFDSFELSLKPGQTARLQYAVVFPGRKQANFLINAVFDPSVISVTRSPFGVDVTALSEGSTLMQSVTNDGVKNIALVTVEK